MAPIAHTVVATREGKFAVAIVQENQSGYAVDTAKISNTWGEAWRIAHADNEAIGVTPDDAWRIVESSMKASRAEGERWGPR